MAPPLSSNSVEEIESLKADILRLQVEKREAESAGKEFLSRNKGLQKELEEMRKSVGVLAAEAKAKEEQKARDGDVVLVEVEQQKEKEKEEKEQMTADHTTAVDLLKKEILDHITTIATMKTDHAKAIEIMKTEMTKMTNEHEAKAITQSVLDKEMIQQQENLQQQLQQQEKEVIQLQQRLQEQQQQHTLVVSELETARDKAIEGR